MFILCYKKYSGSDVPVLPEEELSQDYRGDLKVSVIFSDDTSTDIILKWDTIADSGWFVYDNNPYSGTSVSVAYDYVILSDNSEVDIQLHKKPVLNVNLIEKYPNDWDMYNAVALPKSLIITKH